MLILSRKINEKVMIGDDITVSIVEVRNDQVRIGIDAPKNIKVFRQEVYNAIKEENKAASASAAIIPQVNFGLSAKK
jgi:carbon storage regulator